MKETTITLIICFTILIIGLLVINSWVKIEQTKTMFQFGKGYCKMDRSWIPICTLTP